MGITYKGNCAFDLLDEPRHRVNEWGTDVLEVVYAGKKPDLATFKDTLDQGDTLVYEGATFYLQSWEDDGGRVFPRVTLVYKGFVNGIPDADGQNDTSTKTGSMSATITDPELAAYIKGSALASGESTSVECEREFSFYSPQTTWRYVRNSKPDGPTYDDLNTAAEAVMMRSVITCRWGNKEVRFGGATAPSGAVTATLPALGKEMTHSANHVIGSPYWECQDVVSSIFVGN